MKRRIASKTPPCMTPLAGGIFFAVAMGASGNASADSLVIESGDHWKSINVVDEDPGCPDPAEDSPDWTQVGFDDSDWRQAWAPYVYPPHNGTDPGLGVDMMWDWPPEFGDFVAGRGPTVAFFRLEFELSGSVLDASIQLAVDDNYQVYVNGELAYEDLGGGANLGPVLDITELLEAGENVLAVRAWDGGGGCNVWDRGYEAVALLASVETQSDLCPDDPDKTEPGACGCGVSDVDSDGDGAQDCIDDCPDDPDNDADGDEVCGDVDLCEGTETPESVPTAKLRTNRWALMDDDNVFDTTPPKGNGPDGYFTTEDTGGCSCEQIIEALELGKGHRKFGCSIGVMEEWVYSLGE